MRWISPLADENSCKCIATIEGVDHAGNLFLPECADITMFGDVVVLLLDLMGQSGKIPGAPRVEDVPRALVRLQVAVEADIQVSENEDFFDIRAALRGGRDRACATRLQGSS